MYLEKKKMGLFDKKNADKNSTEAQSASVETVNNEGAPASVTVEPKID